MVILDKNSVIILHKQMNLPYMVNFGDYFLPFIPVIPVECKYC
jgi:hypothetical protein